MNLPAKKFPDIPLIIYFAFLLGIGFVMIFSTSPLVGLQNYNDSYYFIKKYLSHLVVGLGFFLAGYFYEYPRYQKYAVLGVFLAIGLLLLTYIPGLGVTAGGAARWLSIFNFTFQPSELAKIFIVIFVAYAAKNKKMQIQNFVTGVLPILLMVGLVVLLVLKQPSLGSSVVILLTTVAMLFIAGANFWQIFMVSIIGFRAGLFLIERTYYQFQRMLAFLNPWEDPLGRGFQTIQSFMAIGSGGLLGLGLGQSRQKFNYLPQQYTDFIFSIFSEELGFLWSTALIVIFIFLVIRGMQIAAKAPDKFAQLLAAGSTLVLGIQALINLLVVTGLAPTTGVPLPFISYGGSALIVEMFFMGLLLQISRHRTGYQRPTLVDSPE